MSLYCVYIHTYVNYANLACASTIRKTLKKSIVRKSTPFVLSFIKINVYTLKKFLYRVKFLMYINNLILKNLIFMHKFQTEIAPGIFPPKFQKPVQLCQALCMLFHIEKGYFSKEATSRSFEST